MTNQTSTAFEVIEKIKKKLSNNTNSKKCLQVKRKIQIIKVNKREKNIISISKSWH